jgi:bacteriocin-like protein
MTTDNTTSETTLGSILTNVVTITTTKRDNIELTEDDLQRVTGGGGGLGMGGMNPF